MLRIASFLVALCMSSMSGLASQGSNQPGDSLVRPRPGAGHTSTPASGQAHLPTSWSWPPAASPSFGYGVTNDGAGAGIGAHASHLSSDRGLRASILSLADGPGLSWWRAPSPGIEPCAELDDGLNVPEGKSGGKMVPVSMLELRTGTQGLSRRLVAVGLAAPCPVAPLLFDQGCGGDVRPQVSVSDDYGETWLCVTNHSSASRMHAATVSFFAVVGMNNSAGGNGSASAVGGNGKDTDTSATGSASTAPATATQVAFPNGNAPRLAVTPASPSSQSLAAATATSSSIALPSAAGLRALQALSPSCTSASISGTPSASSLAPVSSTVFASVSSLSAVGLGSTASNSSSASDNRGRRAYCSMACTIGGQFGRYLFKKYTQPRADVYCSYDGRVWNQQADLPFPIVGAIAVQAGSDGILVIGGLYGPLAANTSTEVVGLLEHATESGFVYGRVNTSSCAITSWNVLRRDGSVVVADSSSSNSSSSSSGNTSLVTPPVVVLRSRQLHNFAGRVLHYAARFPADEPATSNSSTSNSSIASAEAIIIGGGVTVVDPSSPLKAGEAFKATDYMFAPLEKNTTILLLGRSRDSSGIGDTLSTITSELTNTSATGTMLGTVGTTVGNSSASSAPHDGLHIVDVSVVQETTEVPPGYLSQLHSIVTRTDPAFKQYDLLRANLTIDGSNPDSTYDSVQRTLIMSIGSSAYVRVLVTRNGSAWVSPWTPLRHQLNLRVASQQAAGPSTRPASSLVAFPLASPSSGTMPVGPTRIAVPKVSSTPQSTVTITTAPSLLAGGGGRMMDIIVSNDSAATEDDDSEGGGGSNGGVVLEVDGAWYDSIPGPVRGIYLSSVFNTKTGAGGVDDSSDNSTLVAEISSGDPFLIAYDATTNTVWRGFIRSCPSDCAAAVGVQSCANPAMQNSSGSAADGNNSTSSSSSSVDPPWPATRSVDLPPTRLWHRGCQYSPYDPIFKQCVTCAPGFFEIQTCSETTETVCHRCQTCGNGSIYMLPCTTTSDTVCMPAPVCLVECVQPTATSSPSTSGEEGHGDVPTDGDLGQPSNGRDDGTRANLPPLLPVPGEWVPFSLGVTGWLLMLFCSAALRIHSKLCGKSRATATATAKSTCTAAGQTCAAPAVYFRSLESLLVGILSLSSYVMLDVCLMMAPTFIRQPTSATDGTSSADSRLVTYATWGFAVLATGWLANVCWIMRSKRLSCHSAPAAVCIVAASVHQASTQWLLSHASTVASSVWCQSRRKLTSSAPVLPTLSAGDGDGQPTTTRNDDDQSNRHVDGSDNADWASTNTFTRHPGASGVSSNSNSEGGGSRRHQARNSKLALRSLSSAWSWSSWPSWWSFPPLSFWIIDITHALLAIAARGSSVRVLFPGVAAVCIVAAMANIIYATTGILQRSKQHLRLQERELNAIKAMAICKTLSNTRSTTNPLQPSVDKAEHGGLAVSTSVMQAPARAAALAPVDVGAVGQPIFVSSPPLESQVVSAIAAPQSTTIRNQLSIMRVRELSPGVIRGGGGLFFPVDAATPTDGADAGTVVSEADADDGDAMVRGIERGGELTVGVARPSAFTRVGSGLFSSFPQYHPGEAAQVPRRNNNISAFRSATATTATAAASSPRSATAAANSAVGDDTRSFAGSLAGNAAGAGTGTGAVTGAIAVGGNGGMSLLASRWRAARVERANHGPQSLPATAALAVQTPAASVHMDDEHADAPIANARQRHAHAPASFAPGPSPPSISIPAVPHRPGSLMSESQWSGSSACGGEPQQF